MIRALHAAHLLPRHASLALLAALLGLLAAALPPEPASAARAPSGQEKRAIWRVVLADCRRHASGCRRGGILVSIANPRFALARTRSSGPFGGALVKRGGPAARRWRVKMPLRGGVQSCAEWRRHAPLAVLKDIGVEGSEPGEGRSSPCWRSNCDPPAKRPPGTRAIYSLESQLVGCGAARRLVTRYHTIHRDTGQELVKAGGFDCKGELTPNYEGLVVECRGGKAVVVDWVAQLIY
jgi:hypothetical protein